jgi:hypothetical protein
MFVRFREIRSKLQVSLAEVRRVDRQVRQEHVAGLGTIPISPTVADRIAFWQRLHERQAQLRNRVTPELQAGILGAVHARVPMPTQDEFTATQIEHADADEQFWSGFQSFSEDQAASQKALIARAEREVADSAARATEAAAARDRRERLQRGEDVRGGLGRLFTPEDFERIARRGWRRSGALPAA